MYKYKLVMYGLSQAKGQLTIIYKSRPINEVLNDTSFADSLKVKLKLIAEIKQFATDSLGLSPTNNYNTYYDQKGKALLLVVTASKPFEFKAKEWHFPVLGNVPYKGFFNENLAVLEAVNLRKEGYDVDLGRVSGWSTLGFFKDPVLSNMLQNTVGNIANIIIHELSHSSIFVKDKADFNENLANFIGNKGALLFLEHKYGYSSEEVTEYVRGLEDEKKFNDYVLKTKDKLANLYKHSKLDTLNLEKEKLKLIMISIEKVDNTNIRDTKRYRKVLKKAIYSGNAFFMSFERYESHQDIFKKELKQKFNSNLSFFLQFYMAKYPYL